MTAAREPAPPHVLRTPAEHYALADKLLHEVDGADMTLAFVRHKVARAAVHAQLAQCQPTDEFGDFYYDDSTYCQPAITTLETTGDRL